MVADQEIRINASDPRVMRGGGGGGCFPIQSQRDTDSAVSTTRCVGSAGSAGAVPVQQHRRRYVTRGGGHRSTATGRGVSKLGYQELTLLDVHTMATSGEESCIYIGLTSDKHGAGGTEPVMVAH